MPDAMDTEMTETAAVLPPPNPSGDIRELLAFARQLINQGKPSQALQMGIKSTLYSPAAAAAAPGQDGDDAILGGLDSFCHD
ncbi:hypothetical protein LINPERHAP2_LOCUS41268 [Linum perenne]